MSYSDSKQTLDKIRPMLVNLELGKGDMFKAEPGVTAKQLAYKIREAFHIACLFPESYPLLAQAARVFKVQVVQSGLGGKVQAVLTSRPAGLPGSSEGPGAVVSGLEDAAQLPLKVMGAQTAAAIIQHILDVQKIQPTNSQFFFPQAALAKPEKLRLHSWCSKQTPPWIMLVADPMITISRRTRDITEDLGWNPADDG